MTNEEIPNDIMADEPVDVVDDDSQISVDEPEDIEVGKMIVLVMIGALLFYILSRWS